MSTSETGAGLAAALRAQAEAFAAFIESLDDARFHAPPGPDDWSAAELAGHVSEFPVTFAHQVVALAAAPGMRIHREPTDPGRLAAIARLGGAGPRQAAAIVRGAAEEAAALILGLDEPAWAVTGVRPDGEVVTAKLLVERYAIGHLVMHLAQAEAAAG